MFLQTSNYLRVLPLPGRPEVVIYHSLCGNPVVASPDTTKLLELFREPREEEAAMRRGVTSYVLELFRRNSFLVPEGTDERSKLQEVAKERSLRIESGDLVTYLRFFSAYCNFACSYCSVTQIDQLGHERMISMRTHYPWSVAQRAVDAFLSLARKHGHKVVRIRFFGGEALIDWKTYRRVIEYVIEQTDRPEVEFYLNTNGSLITPDIAEFLKRYRIKTIVSLDGVAEVNDAFRVYPSGKGTYRSVLAGLERLREVGVEIHVNVTLNRANIDHLRETIDFAKKLGAHDVGVEDLCFVDCGSTAFAVEVERQTAAIIDGWYYGQEVGIPVRGSWTGFRSLPAYTGPVNYCAGNGEELCVDHEGKVFPCFGIPLSIGTIGRLEECFAHPVYRAMALRMTGTIAECRDCELEGPCGGGCAADAFTATHDVTRVARDKCDMRRLISRQLLTEWAKNQERR